MKEGKRLLSNEQEWREWMEVPSAEDDYFSSVLCKCPPNKFPCVVIWFISRAGMYWKISFDFVYLSDFDDPQVKVQQ